MESRCQYLFTCLLV